MIGGGKRLHGDVTYGMPAFRSVFTDSCGATSWGRPQAARRVHISRTSDAAGPRRGPQLQELFMKIGSNGNIVWIHFCLVPRT